MTAMKEYEYRVTAENAGGESDPSDGSLPIKAKKLKGVVRSGVVWCGVVWCGVVWCGVVWCGVVCCGVVWCGVMWRWFFVSTNSMFLLFF